MKDLNCLRCGRRMEFCRREYLQLGKTGWITGDWGNLLAGAMDVVVLRCPDCGKLEFFQGDALRGRARGRKENCPRLLVQTAACAMTATILSVRCAAQRILFFEEGTKPWVSLTN